MSLFHKRRTRFKFTEKKHSKKGIAAFAVALFLFILFFVFLILSYRTAGNLSVYFGSVGFLAMVCSIGNLILSIMSMREENSFQLYPRLALGFTVFDLLVWIGMYIIGL